MTKVMLRLDGVIADVLFEFNEYFNMFRPMGYDCDGSPVSMLRARSAITPTCKNLIKFIPTQPEPYRRMKLLPESLETVQILRAKGWEVEIFSDEVQKPEKISWLQKNLPDIEVVWVEPPIVPDGEDPLIVLDHELNITPSIYGGKPYELVFYPYSEKEWGVYTYPGVYTWKDDWLKKITEKVLLQTPTEGSVT